MKKILLTISVLLFFPAVAFATTDVFTSSSNWTAPAGVTSVQINAWAAGGGGGSNAGNSGGGAGGGFAGVNTFSVTPGNSYTVTVGTGGAQLVAGGDSWFNATSTIWAVGGPAGANGGTAGGVGVATSTMVGDVLWKGGNGGQGATGPGGGGGGAGTTANGTNGVSGAGSGNGGAGGSVGGGVGGGAQNSQTAGTNGGGGAGGAHSGARGEVDVTYTVTVPPATSGISVPQGTLSVGGGTLSIP